MATTNGGTSRGALWVAGCPECGVPAEVIDEGTVVSTDGLVPLVRTLCTRRHWFLLSADRLPVAPQAWGAIAS
jgi:hypothetical protein